MENTDMDCINTTLDELEDGDFKKFQRFLLEPANLDGQRPIGRALLLKKDRMETADVILQTYPDNVDQIMANILGKINKTVLQKQYAVKAQSNGAAGSGPEVAFVNKHKPALIKRVTMVAPILDLLAHEGVMQSEDYGEVRAEKTSQGKMRGLFVLLESRGPKAKRVFYKGLEENESYLMNDLNNPE